MTKKVLSSVLCFMLIASYFISVSAAELIVNGSFNDTGMSFEGLSLYDASSIGKNACGILKNCEYQDDYYSYKAEYLYPVHLLEGRLYRLSMRVYCAEKTGVSSYSTTSFDNKNKNVIFSVYDACDSWQMVSAVFIAGSENEYGIIVDFIAETENNTILIDDISLTEYDTSPTSLRIEGPSAVLVPESGYLSYNFRATAIDSHKNTVPIIQCGISFSELPAGVTYNDELETIIVSSDANDGESFEITATPPSSLPSLPGVTLTVTTCKNYIVNGDFNDYPDLNGFFSSTGNLFLKKDPQYGKTAYIESVEIDENNYLASVNIDNTYFLDASKIYVFRAMVRSESSYPSRKTDATNGILNPDGSISINITNVGAQWSLITSVIEVPREGIYQLNINFSAPDSRPVYFDCVGLYAESLRPTKIIYSAPAHICIPDTEVLSLPFDYAVLDQRNNLISGEDIDLSVNPPDNGVYIEGKTLFVSKNTVPGVYEICAYDKNYPEATGVHKIDITKEMIGDGSFEAQATGQWFSTASPSIFNIATIYKDFVPSDGEKFGKLTFNGCVSALLSDSVIKLSAGKAYVFNSYIKAVVPDIATTVTVMIYNVRSNNFEDNLAVLQYDIDGRDEYNKVFVPEKDITGRLMIAFTTPAQHDSQIALIDNITITNAKTSASKVVVSGYPYPERVLTGKYQFSSNFETTDMSTYRWLISPTKEGVYIPISGETDISISLTREMLGKFLKLEVTPCSLNGPVSGEAMVSSPIEIKDIPNGGGGSQYISAPSNEDYEDDKPAQIPNTNTVNRGTTFSVINIYAQCFSSSNNFFDAYGHWAEQDIILMNAAGIVNGRTNNLFEPNEPITRAEFAAFMIRAFSLAPLYYEGGFDDVNSWDWYSGVVETVTKYNMAQGIGDKLFAPLVPMNREQMTLMTMKALQMTGVKVNDYSKIVFTDSSKISSWALDAVNKATSSGIISGYNDGTFRPHDNTTRAEAVAIIKRMLTYVITAEE